LAYSGAPGLAAVGRLALLGPAETG